MRNTNTPSTLKGLVAAALVAAAAVAAPAQTASSAYRGAQRDPFAKFKPALKRRVIQHVGVEERFARVLALPEAVLRKLAVLGIHLAPAIDVREHEDVA